MKRLLYFIVAALVLVGCSHGRDNILKVYNWADYIDEELIGEFEQWYKEQTGESVTIIYQTFDINETMLSKIELGHEDYDVVCPSDYIIERMLKNDLLIPIDKDFGSTPNYLGNISPYILDKFSQMDGNGKNANDYSVAYMWGTVGLIYNPKYINEEEVSSWNVLANPEYKGKVLLKDAKMWHAPNIYFLLQPRLMTCSSFFSFPLLGAISARLLQTLPPETGS